MRKVDISTRIFLIIIGELYTARGKLLNNSDN